MKGILTAVLMAALLLGGCAAQEEAPATLPSETVELPMLGTPGKNVASVILGDIWAQYEQYEKFSVYGGMMERPVPDAPGDLDLERSQGWASRCSFPLGCLALVKQGASLTHLLNEQLFTATTVCVADEEDLSLLADNWRREAQHCHRQTGAPSRLLMMQLGEKYLVVAMGSRSDIALFRQKTTQAYPVVRILYDEPLTC